ncbi:bactofilin family protein [Sulfuriroseicoccus oceanibius]|uniref:Polymer-forming cytoskeletal protein n=1 Tax=Sulfuriroseicoccus oceanibius TaxID=2707525 RepID=A0A6B3LBE0_9BACT|nr:polymer-forming cytoskeletal protein [Sulfuriroseicoccus oceanibius]QQL45974.1 polymer-forming cytoskeletal protein [Sulfuriroseicoccus oceanibius]
MNTTKNILSNDVEIKGSLKFSNDLVIDGKIEGEISSDGSLTIGENAHIKGEVAVKAVTVFGKVEGNITVTERCELKSNSELLGDVKARTLAIEEGATFLGKSIVGAAAATKAGSDKPAQKPAGGQSSSQPELVKANK